MVVLDVNNYRLECPVCWEETTTAQYQRVKAVKDADLVKIFCALLNLKVDEVEQASASEIETVIYQVASYLFNSEEYFRAYPVPDYFSIGKHKVIVPKKIESLTVAQTMYLRQQFKDGDYLEQYISIAIAVYLQPLIDGDKFHVERALELEKRIAELPIEDTFPLGFFLLNRLNRFGRNGFRYWLKQIIRQTTSIPSWRRLQALTS
jgi:hypothetical protein